jgi:1-deoxy-D-xylulose-5-phosphate reductoisomerase
MVQTEISSDVMPLFFETVETVAKDLAAKEVDQDELDRALRPRREGLARNRITNGYWMGALNGVQADEQRRLADIRRFPDLYAKVRRRSGAEIVPIDSEHSAILQCLEGHESASVHRVVLTASGGPFRGRNSEELWHVGPEDALRHPTWEMGSKITIDSATLANKALEVIEAHHLYGLEYGSIDAVIHPQSVIHSFVEFVDGSVLAQLGFPTMELPILYALSYPERVSDAALRTFDPVRSSPLTFEDIDRDAFPMFGLGESAGRTGGCMPAVYNASNEMAVEAFLDERIRFPEIAEVVDETMVRVGSDAIRDLDDVIAADAAARLIAAEVATRLGEARMRTTQ